MQFSQSLPLCTPTPSILPINPNQKASIFAFGRKPHEGRTNFVACKAKNSSFSSCPITEFDLYDLLGIDSSSNQAQIKLAYRALQKRCHPDIAGAAGHEMAIILNEAYAVLSDPASRMVYDKEQAKFSDLRGYTGKPIYSVWHGSESEQRAVFVDEVKCVGCLKCALFAKETFAIESVYGRARVIAQWADPEEKIREAIDSCPVNCISIVERSNLAALEFLMLKQPRGRVRIGTGNTAGVRSSDIFDEVEKFQSRYAKHKDSRNHLNDSEPGTTARISAIQAIRAISNWFYWQSPRPGPTSSTHRTLALLSEKPIDEPNVMKLRDAAMARKKAEESPEPIRRVSSSNTTSDEYWAPSNLALPEAVEATHTNSHYKISSGSSPSEESYELTGEQSSNHKDSRSPFQWVIPLSTATIAAVYVRLQVGDPVAGIEDHIGGSLVRDVINSSWLQVILAGVTWYLIGMAIGELAEALKIKLGNEK